MSDDSSVTTFARTLVLVRHGQSEDNAQDLFSGLRNPALTQQGIDEAHEAGRALKALGFRFTDAFTSRLQRAQATLDIILDELGQADLAVTADAALNERDYGGLAGLNKTQARAQFGEEQVHLWRKSYDAVPAGGESLAMTAKRAWAFYEAAIEPRLAAGATVLVVGHGNTLRSMMMRLDGISATDIEEVNVGTAEFMIYEMDAAGRTLTRKARPA